MALPWIVGVPCLSSERTQCTAGLARRMVRLHVPQLALALVRDHRIVESYRLSADGRVHPDDRLFQVASVSKPVAAAVALHYLPLDDTLQKRLSHSAGVTVPGFDGYAAGEPLPTLAEVIAGQPPANSPPIIDGPDACGYSGGGYTLVQAQVERVAGTAFGAAARPVLDALGMACSAYAPDPPGPFVPGHDAQGMEIAGGYRRHPELAAAGLWSTAADMARFEIALMDSPQIARVSCGYGLGPRTRFPGQFEHGGMNRGYRAYFWGNARSGSGFVMLTNADNGLWLIAAIAPAYLLGRY